MSSCKTAGCLAAICAVSLVTSCGDPKNGSSCENEACPAGRICDPGTLLCIANEVPTIELESPVPGSLVSGKTVELRGRVADDQALTAAEFSMDQGATWTPLPVASGRFTNVVDLPVADGSEVHFQARVTDLQNASAVASASVTVDNVPPNCAAVSPSDGQLLGAAGAAGFTVEFSALDGSGPVASAFISTGDGTGFRPALVQGTKVALPWPLPSEDGVAHALTLKATDAAGNECQASVNVKVDTVAPLLSIVSPPANAILGGAATSASWTGTTSDGSPAALIVTADFADGAGARTATVAAGVWTVAMPLPATEDYRAHNVKVAATDAAGNVTSLLLPVFVDKVAPVLNLTSPAAGAKLGLAQLAVSGDAQVAWTATDADPQLALESRLGAGAWTAAAGSALTVTTAAADNPASYSVTIRATDRAGNASSVTRDFQVDRVRPTVSAQVPADSSRLTPESASVTFSEPVTPVAAASVLAFTRLGSGPVALTGTWNGARTVYTVSPLDFDTVYQASVAAAVVQDDFGNQNTATSTANFLTAAMFPSTGVTLAIDVGGFDVAFDPEGHLELATWSSTPTPTVALSTVDPKTAAVVERFRVANGTKLYAQAFSWRNVNADLTSTRVYGLAWRPSSGGPVVYWGTGSSAYTTESAYSFVPTPATPAEGTGLGLTAKIRSYSGVAYDRIGRAADLVDVVPTHLGYTETNWALVSVAPPNLYRQEHDCTFVMVSGGGKLWSCAYAPALGSVISPTFTNLAASPDYSLANTPNCWVDVYNDNAGTPQRRFARHRRYCEVAPCPDPATIAYPVADGLKVAASYSGDQLIGVVGASASLSVLLLDLGPECLSYGWGVAGSLAVPAGSVTSFRPVLVGTRPAAVYLTTSGDLKLYIP